MKLGKIWDVLVWLNGWGASLIILAFYTTGIFS